MDIRRRRQVGGFAWGAGLFVAMIWSTLDGRSAEGVGYGFAPPVNVAALETARILAVPVDLHQEVHKGDVVVRMDPTPLVEERKVAEANVERERQERNEIQPELYLENTGPGRQRENGLKTEEPDDRSAQVGCPQDEVAPGIGHCCVSISVGPQSTAT